MEDSPYTCNKITFQKGDYIFLYTDGIIDALDSEGNDFSKETLLKIVAGNHDGLNGMLKSLEARFFEHVSGGKITDDVTYMVLRNGSD